MKRRSNIDSFLEIPADVFQSDGRDGPPKVLFYAENAPLAEEKGWLGGVLNDAVRTRRLEQAGIDPEVVRRVSGAVILEPARLSEKSETGEIQRPKQFSEAQAVFLPFGLMMLMWMVIFLAAQPMLESMLLPVWLIFMYPLFVWLQVVREPNGSFATWLSLVPPGIPMMMVLRIGATGAVPLWQPLAGAAIMVAFTLAVVAAAGRVFRIGILAQGKVPTLLELARWAVRG